MARSKMLIIILMIILNPTISLSDVYRWKHFQIDHAELSDFSRWLSVSYAGLGCSSPSYDSDIKNSGNKSIRFSCTDITSHSKQSYLTGSFWYSAGATAATVDPLYLRFDIYLDNSFVVQNTNDSVRIFELNNSIPVLLSLRKLSADKIVLFSGVAGTTNITKGVWHSVEVKYASGLGVGEFTVWLDNVQELKLTGQRYNAVTRFDIGWKYSNSTANGSIYIDDIMWDNVFVGIPSGPRVDLIYPDFRGRVGVKVIALLSGWEQTDKLIATLSNTSGLISTPYNTNAINSGKIVIPVNLNGLSAGNYTFLVQLLTSGDFLKAEERYSFYKPYSGDPEFSIDENNNFIKSGYKYFPVTDYGNLKETSAEWIANGYINMHYGQDWNSPSVSKWLLHVNYLWNHASRTMTGGPDINGFSSCMTKDQWLTYVNNSALVRGVAYYSPMDEPHTVKRCGSSFGKQWFDAVKENDSIRLVHINHAGRTELKDGWGRDWFWPRMTSDIYSWDHYPVAYNSGDFTEFISIAERCTEWTYGLNPCMAYIQTTDTEPTPSCTDKIPTDAQIKANAWEAVVLGHKGIHWYHWQCSGQNQYVAMKDFVEWMKVLQSAVLGEDTVDKVSVENISGRIDTMVKFNDGKYFIFAVNTKNRTEFNAKINFSLLQSGKNIYVYGENRIIKSNQGYFIDSFQGHNMGDNPVHIYYFGTSQSLINLPPAPPSYLQIK